MSLLALSSHNVQRTCQYAASYDGVRSVVNAYVDVAAPDMVMNRSRILCH